MSEKAQLYFEDVNVGDDVTTLVKGPMTTTHLMRWSAAIIGFTTICRSA